VSNIVDVYGLGELIYVNHADRMVAYRVHKNGLSQVDPSSAIRTKEAEDEAWAIVNLPSLGEYKIQ